MTRLTVVAPGAFTTVQDRGRPGRAALGVGRSGAADATSAARANRLAGNDPDAALFECVLGGLHLTTDAPLLVAATGTTATLLVAGRRHPTGAVVRWPPGADLQVGTPELGLRTYLAVRGGLEVAPVLGSRSTDTLSGLGPPPLRPGDVLAVGDRVDGAPVRAGVVETPPAGTVVLDATPGPRADWYDLAELGVRRWRVSPDLDRVGVRLLGEPLTRGRTGELPSEGVVRGAVQVPADGRPLVFGPDHPTTGGYPVVAVVTDAGCDRVAQVRPGTAVTFRLRRG